MGGRGSKYRRKNADIDEVIALMQGDGTVIDLKDAPLRYGDDDPNLQGTNREVVEEFENKRYKNKIEYSRLVDRFGRVVEEGKGGKGSVKISYGAAIKAEVLTHNHPRTGSDVGVIGGTFSYADLVGFTRYQNLKTARATALEGTYSISKTKDFNGIGFLTEMRHKDEALRDHYQNLIWDAPDNATANRIFNQYLVASHNYLLENQAKYGYIYTLERRKSK